MDLLKLSLPEQVLILSLSSRTTATQTLTTLTMSTLLELFNDGWIALSPQSDYVYLCRALPHPVKILNNILLQIADDIPHTLQYWFEIISIYNFLFYPFKLLFTF